MRRQLNVYAIKFFNPCEFISRKVKCENQQMKTTNIPLSNYAGFYVFLADYDFNQTCSRQTQALDFSIWTVVYELWTSSIDLEGSCWVGRWPIRFWWQAQSPGILALTLPGLSIKLISNENDNCITHLIHSE